MLPSSSITPAASSLVSSEAFTVMMLPARSSQNVESKDLDTESESDAEEETYVSENGLETTGEWSNTVEEDGNTNSTGAASGRTEGPVKDDKQWKIGSLPKLLTRYLDTLVRLCGGTQMMYKRFLYYRIPTMTTCCCGSRQGIRLHQCCTAIDDWKVIQESRKGRIARGRTRSTWLFGGSQTV